jgi:large subunit ribosomal protein L6
MFTKTIDLGEIEAQISAGKITLKSGEIKITRSYPTQRIDIKKEGTSIIVTSRYGKAADKALTGTFEAHIKNMINGLKTPYVYKLKICSSHFPMSLKISEDEAQLTNFFGEKKPRRTKLPKGVEVKVEGEIIIVQSPDIELAGIAATRIEQLTHLNNKDRRVFQDGIYMVEKAGKPIR